MLNIPKSVLKKIQGKKNVLITGIGGGFDIYGGVPIHLSLISEFQNTNFHLANLTFTDLNNVESLGKTTKTGAPKVVGSTYELFKNDGSYYPEGWLSNWFFHEFDSHVPIWMIPKQGALSMKKTLISLIKALEIDFILMVDGGVDSIMTGEERGSGTIIEDSISMAAISECGVDMVLACIGLGTEVEEKLCNYSALENMSNIAKNGGLYGSCSLVKGMEAYDFYKSACEHAFEIGKQKKSHIQSRIIPCVEGEFGMKGEFMQSLLSCQYWFFDAHYVVGKNLLVEKIKNIDGWFETIQTSSPYLQSIKSRERKQFTL